MTTPPMKDLKMLLSQPIHWQEKYLWVLLKENFTHDRMLLLRRLKAEEDLPLLQRPLGLGNLFASIGVWYARSKDKIGGTNTLPPWILGVIA